MTALAFHSPAVRGLQGNTLTLTAEESEQLKKLCPCPESACRGGEVSYPEWEGRVEACQDCGGSGFSVSKRPILGAAPAVPCPMMHPHWQPCLSEPAGVLWVADEIERVMATDDPELGAAVWLRGVRRLAKPLTEWPCPEDGVSYEPPEFAEWLDILDVEEGEIALDEPDYDGPNACPGCGCAAGDTHERRSVASLPAGFSEAPVGLVEATKETA